MATLPVAGRVTSDASDAPRHPFFVRVSHWVSAASVAVLLLSGVAILIAHPRLYWGEVGALGGPSLIDLPLPWVLDVPIRGPGRYLHFLAAWILVFTGLAYATAGVVSGHLRRALWPRPADLSWAAVRQVVVSHLRPSRHRGHVPGAYNGVQRLSYTSVVFVLTPLMIWTGLAMSPAVTSVLPFLVTSVGGQQSARTIHFFTTCVLVLFVLVHVGAVWQTGLAANLRAMVTGRRSPEEERP